MKKILYHGSNKIIEKPIYGVGNKHNDYGLGFYCCTNLSLAKEWACRKDGFGFVNKYSFRDDNLKILDLTENEDVLVWLNLLIKNRSTYSELKSAYPKEVAYLDKKYGIDVNGYDVIIGYRADDSYFRFPISFVRNEITLTSLETIYKAGNLGKQYVLMSERAFELLHYISYEECGLEYKTRYYDRKTNADNRYQQLLINDRYSKEDKIIDLLKHDK